MDKVRNVGEAGTVTQGFSAADPKRKESLLEKYRAKPTPVFLQTDCWQNTETDSFMNSPATKRPPL